MADDATDIETLFETTVFLDYFKELPDPRQAGKVVYRLDELLLLSLLAVLAGADTFCDIARFGEKKLDLLRRFLPFENGAPTHDRIGEIYAALDPAALQRCFAAWAARLTNSPVEVIEIDGKTLRGSGGKRKDSRAAIHVVSAFAARHRLVLAQTKVAEKSNEITAIPALLDMLSIEGAVVTIDAMGCQRAIVQKIIDKKAHYIIALKGNQGTLLADVELFVTEQKANGFKHCRATTHQSVDADHGRIETRRYSVIHDVDWLQARHGWPGLKGVIIVESRRETGDKIETETRLYITSTDYPAAIAGPMTREHWAIENGLHWVMDMTFRDDECRVRTEHAPANFATVKHMAQNVMRLAPSKDSMRLRRKTAAWDDEYLASMIIR